MPVAQTSGIHDEPWVPGKLALKRSQHPARPAWILATYFVVFSVARAVLYGTWRSNFDELSFTDLLAALGRGLVFDASVIALALAPVMLALILPFEFAGRRGWRSTWTWIAYAELCVLALVLAGDVFYFGIVGRHAGHEFIGMVDDPALMVSIVSESYAIALSGMIVALMLLAVAWRRMMAWDERLAPKRAPAWTAFAMAPVILFVVRGNAVGKPITVVDAFASGSVEAGYLSLNGPFSIGHSILDSANVPTDFMPWETAVESVQSQYFGAQEHAIDPAFPLLRERDVSAASHPNVVVLLLESWDADVVDALRVEQGAAPLGLTPNFDALCREGVLFTHFYAAGQRSTHGLLAVLAGLPTLPGMPYLGHGVEQSRLSYLGRLALAEGYSTYLLQGSKERSFRVDSIAALAGFEHYAGRDGVLAATGHEPMADWGAWDGDLLQTAHGWFAKSAQPFAGVVFTTSTHLPFQVPAAHASPYPKDSERHAYWNSVHYADSAIGEFFTAARAAGYFANTIFVLVSDHRSGLDLGGKSAPEMHHIPCLVIAPGLKPRVERRVASQLDVLPTLVDLAHWTSPYAALGRSLFDESTAKDGAAVCARNEVILRIDETGWLTHDLHRRLDAKALGSRTDFDGIERKLLAAQQVVADCLHTNRISPASAAPAVVETAGN
jgi:phosphoglycerol transferase MdoB-like AlkP superfamily enzyme